VSSPIKSSQKALVDLVKYFTIIVRNFTIIGIYMKSREVINNINSLINQSIYLYAKYAQTTKTSYVDMMVLYALLNTDKPLTQMELCNYYGMSKQSVNTSVKKFKEDGVILVAQDKEDKRQKYLKLSHKGAEYAHSIVDNLMRIEDEVSDIIGEKNKAIIEGLEMYNVLFEKRLSNKD